MNTGSISHWLQSWTVCNCSTFITLHTSAMAELRAQEVLQYIECRIVAATVKQWVYCQFYRFSAYMKRLYINFVGLSCDNWSWPKSVPPDNFWQQNSVPWTTFSSQKWSFVAKTGPEGTDIASQNCPEVLAAKSSPG